VAIVCSCILFAQRVTIRNYLRKPTRRHAAFIYAFLFWSAGFSLRRFDVIGDGVYAGSVALFLLLVFFIRLKGRVNAARRAN